VGPSIGVGAWRELTARFSGLGDMDRHADRLDTATEEPVRPESGQRDRRGRSGRSVRPLTWGLMARSEVRARRGPEPPAFWSVGRHGASTPCAAVLPFAFLRRSGPAIVQIGRLRPWLHNYVCVNSVTSGLAARRQPAAGQPGPAQARTGRAQPPGPQAL